MKKISFSIILLIAFTTIALGKPIDENIAKAVAQNFLSNKTKIKNFENLQLVYKSIDGTVDKNVLYYIFNFSSGFIIVSADDNTIPILGYSNEKTFNVNKIPNQVKSWMNIYQSQIQYAIENKIIPSNEIKTKWNELIKGDKQNTILGGDDSVIAPLITTQWNQTEFYNDSCPGKTYAGCTAVAMAQTMKYWNYPAIGVGSHSYDAGTYGTQSADFGNTKYDWISMPNSLDSTNKAVATLLFHCGVSVNTSYSVQASAGCFECAESALKIYFKYRISMKCVKRTKYTESKWIDLLKTELIAKRPVIFTGSKPTGGGHTFVCDGVDANNYFHFNWGWGGACDGYFSINSLTPDVNRNYSIDQLAIIGIEPSVPSPTQISPSNNSVAQPITMNFAWQDDYLQGTASYYIQISTDSTFAKKVINDSLLTITSYSYSNFQKDTKYYWRVRGSHSHEVGNWSSIWNFNTIKPAPQIDPTCSIDSTKSNPLSGILKWKKVDKAISYHVQISEFVDFHTTTMEQDSINGTTYTYNLGAGKKYYWRVNANFTDSSSGTVVRYSGEWSQSSKFSTKLDIPTAQSPANLSIGIEPATGSLKWLSVSGATQYSLQLSFKKDFTNNIIDQNNVASTSYQYANLIADTLYYWRLKAQSLDVTSDWSSAWSFRTSTHSSIEEFVGNVNAIDLHAYPNPIGNSTTLEFNVLSNANVNLKIYNVFGQEIESLMNTNSAEAGHYKIQWVPESSRYANGVYIAKIVVGNLTQSINLEINR